MVLSESTAEEVSFEWSYYWISSTDSKVRTSIRDSIVHSGRKKKVERPVYFRNISVHTAIVFSLARLRSFRDAFEH